MADFSTVARPYAKAVFGIANDSGKLAEWSAAIAAAASVVAAPDAKAFLAQPNLGTRERAAFVASVGAKLDGGSLLADRLGKSFLELLAENDRLGALGEIAAQFEALRDQAENKINVTVVSATPIETALATKIAAALERRHGRRVDLKLETDTGLLGGAVVKADDRVVDGSVKTRLKRLAESLID